MTEETSKTKSKKISDAERELLPLFTAFDLASEAEAADKDPVDFIESRARLANLIDKLPQAKAISPDDANRWLDRTMRVATERMILENGGSEDGVTVGDVHRHVFWHIRRASGIGGSEISTVVKHYRGKLGSWGDANKLVKEKLLMLSPMPSTDEMARGVRAEPWIQKMFHEKAGTRSDTESLNKLRNFRWEKNPAGVGTPDEISLSADESVRRLHDFKAPSALVMEDYDSNGISFDYVCQLHHYEILARAAGIEFHGRSIEALDPRVFQVREFDVEFDAQLARDITTATRRIWMENVMEGIIPKAPKPEDLEVESREMQILAVEMAMYKVLIEDLTSRSDRNKEKISEMARDWHDVATGKLDAAVGTYSRDRVWDTDELVNLAKSAGIEVDDLYIEDAKKPKIDTDDAARILADIYKSLVDGTDDVGEILDSLKEEGIPYIKKLDVETLVKRCEEVDLSIVTAMKVKETFRLTASKKANNPQVIRLAKLRADMSEVGDSLEKAICDNTDDVMDAEFKKDEEDTPELG